MSESQVQAADLPTEAPVRPSPGEQRRMIKELLGDQKLKVGTTEYIIPFNWWKEWKEYVRYSSSEEPEDFSAPGPIDNTPLIDTFSKPSAVGKPIYKLNRSKNLTENLDYVFVNEEAWQKLKEWYGCEKEIGRPVVSKGYAQVDVWPVIGISYLYDPEATDEEKTREGGSIMLPRSMSIKDARKKMCEVFGVTFVDKSAASSSAEKTEELDNQPSAGRASRLWTHYGKKHVSLLAEDDMTECDSIGTYYNILLELAKDDGTFEFEEKNTATGTSTGYSSTAVVVHSDNNTTSSTASSTTGTSAWQSSYWSGSSYSKTYSYGSADKPGLTGLTNLGNTCFMNSGLQCLSNTAPLRKYLLDKTYEGDVNRTNPLGMGGKLAEVFAALVTDIWESGKGVVSPWDFKSTIGKFAPQFSGYQQQDSQEFLAYILDGLHEDLNRVIKKPLTSQVESNGRPDHEVAAEAWSVHKMRNDSFVVDNMQGQLKSTLVCPKDECGKVSVTFDPFMFLSVPLPYERSRIMDVVFIPRPAADKPNLRPVKVALKVNKRGFVSDLRRNLASTFGIEMSDIVLAEAYNHRFFKFFVDTELLDDIRDNDIIVAYEVPGLGQYPDFHIRHSTRMLLRDHPEIHAPLVPCVMWVWKMPNYTYTYYKPTPQATNVGIPFVIPFTKLHEKADAETGVVTAADLYDYAFEFLLPYMHALDPELSEVDTPEAWFKVEEEREEKKKEAEAAATEGETEGEKAPEKLVPRPPFQLRLLDESYAQENSGKSLLYDREHVVFKYEPEELAILRSPPAEGSLKKDDYWSVGFGGSSYGQGFGSNGANSGGAAASSNNNTNNASNKNKNAAASTTTSDIMELEGVAASGDNNNAAGAEACDNDNKKNATSTAIQDDYFSGANASNYNPDAWSEAVEDPAMMTEVPLGPLGPVNLSHILNAAAGSNAGYEDDIDAEASGFGASHASPNVSDDEEEGACYERDVPIPPLSSDIDEEVSTLNAAAASLSSLAKPAATTTTTNDIEMNDINDHGVGVASDPNDRPISSVAAEKAPAAATTTTTSTVASTATTNAVPPAPAFSGYKSTKKNEDGRKISMELDGQLADNLEKFFSECETHTSWKELRGESSQDAKVTLEDCMKLYIAEERLGEGDEWFCPKCHDHVQASKKIDLFNLPKVLVVHLKRFSYTSWRRDKIEGLVDYPITGLDMSPFITNKHFEHSPIYDLYAVSVHSGGLYGGHYWAYAKTEHGWYEFNDSSVHKISEDQVKTPNAYVLFYQRRDVAEEMSTGGSSAGAAEAATTNSIVESDLKDLMQ